MITMLFINFVTLFLGMIFYFAPVVSFATLPVIGSAVSSTLYTMVSYWNAVLVTIPYFALPWWIFTHIIIYFEIGLIVIRLFLGHRSPVQ